MLDQDVKTHPGLAAVFSFIFNGLGQIYNGQIIKGLTIIFLSTISMFILIIGSVVIGLWFLGKISSFKMLGIGTGLFFAGTIFICILGIYSIFDAYKTASRK